MTVSASYCDESSPQESRRSLCLEYSTYERVPDAIEKAFAECSCKFLTFDQRFNQPATNYCQSFWWLTIVKAATLIPVTIDLSRLQQMPRMS